LITTMSNAGFVKENIFGMPFDFDWLGDKISQYCVYGYFKMI
jgi:hypothetical protein